MLSLAVARKPSRGLRVRGSWGGVEEAGPLVRCRCGRGRGRVRSSFCGWASAGDGEADVAGGVGVEEVFGGGFEAGGGSEKLGPGLGAGQGERAEIAGGARFGADPAQDVGAAAGGIDSDDGSVDGVAALDGFGAAAFDFHGVALDGHPFPDAGVEVIVEVGGAELFDVEILLVGAGNGEAETDGFVVAEGDAGQGGFACADSIDAGGDEVDGAAEAGDLEGAVGVALARRGLPVVERLPETTQLLEPWASRVTGSVASSKSAMAPRVMSLRFSSGRDVGGWAGRWGGRVRGRRVRKRRVGGRGRPLAEDVGHHREDGDAGEDVFRFPETGFVAKLLELSRAAAALLDVGVDAVREGAGDGVGTGA
jgi:hypothetical protein